MDSLIYLDSSFITSKFEEVRRAPANAQFSKTEGGKAGIGFSFVNAGVHTQETVTFKKSSTAMLQDLLPDLEKKYESLDFSGFKNYTGTQMAWIEGKMSIQAWRNRERPEEKYDYYGVLVGDEKVALISDPAYFSPGFAKVISAPDTLVGYVGIPVRVLARILWHMENTGEYVAVPLVVYELEVS